MLLLATSVWKHVFLYAKDTPIQKYMDLILFQMNSCYSLYKYSEKFLYDNVIVIFLFACFLQHFWHSKLTHVVPTISHTYSAWILTQ